MANQSTQDIMGMFATLNNRISFLQQGLQPETLWYWHRLVVEEARTLAPPWLQDKINVTQDPHLPMKFSLDISKRAAKYYVMAVDANLHDMPHSTRLYFLKVCEELGIEMDRGLV